MPWTGMSVRLLTCSILFYWADLEVNYYLWQNEDSLNVGPKWLVIDGEDAEIVI